MPDRMVVIFDLDDEPLLAQLVTDRLPGFQPILPEEFATRLGDVGFRVDDLDRRQVMPLRDLEVERIVRRRHLDGTGTELEVDALVGHDRDLPADQRKCHRLADHIPVAIVVRMDGNRGIPQHRLRASGRNHDRSAAVAEGVADVGQLPGLLLVLYLDLGESGVAAGTPVDDALPAVDEPLVVEIHEHLLHRVAEPVVEGEALPAPVCGETETTDLLLDPVAVLGLPCPDTLDEPLTT